MDTLCSFLVKLFDGSSGEMGEYDIKELTPYMTVLYLTEDFAYDHSDVNCIHFFQTEKGLIDVEFVTVNKESRTVNGVLFNCSSKDLKRSIERKLSVSL